VREEFLGEESLGEKMCKKGFWVKSLWVTNIGEHRDRWDAGFRSPLLRLNYDPQVFWEETTNGYPHVFLVV